MPHLIDQGKKLPMIIVSPQCPIGLRWEDLPLMELLDEMEKRFSVDRQRIYIMGFSMGGNGTWNLASQRPERFAALVSIAGAGDTKTANKLVDLPAWVFHGLLDDVIPLKEMTIMVEAIETFGGKKVTKTVFPQAKHGIENQVLAQPELFKWLLEQKRARSSVRSK